MAKPTELDNTIEEFEMVRDDLQEMLMDIRVFLMEASTPIPNDLERAKLRQELDAKRR